MDTSRFNRHRLDEIACGELNVFFVQKSLHSIEFYIESKLNEFLGNIEIIQLPEEDADAVIRVYVSHHVIKLSDLARLIEQLCESLAIPSEIRDIRLFSCVKNIRLPSDNYWKGLTVSVGEPDPDENFWDENTKVELDEIIDRQSALAMLHFALTQDENDPCSKRRKDFFMQDGSAWRFAVKLAERLEAGDEEALFRFFDVVENLLIYGDLYTRQSSLHFLFCFLAYPEHHVNTHPEDYRKFMKLHTLQRFGEKLIKRDGTPGL